MNQYVEGETGSRGTGGKLNPFEKRFDLRHWQWGRILEIFRK